MSRLFSSWWITVLSMFLSIWVYQENMGWKFAAGFVLLILVHEMGHVVAALRFNLRSSPPIFVPYLGALILIRDRTQNAWIEAIVGIGGPLFGTIGAAVCYLVHVYTGQTWWATLAYYGFMLNLFNLAPVGFLDGGRIVTAISPWLWIVGYLLMIAYGVLVWRQTGTLPQLLVFVLILGLPRLFSLFRERTPEMNRFFNIEPGQRWSMGAAYIGLVVLLSLGMYLSAPKL
jgi:Zn-dependent protease